MCTHSSGNNKGNLHFIWRVLTEETIEDAFSRSQKVIEFIRPHLSFPVFHTRAMRKEMFSKFDRVAPSVKPSVLRHFYHELTGDSSAANCLNESEIDARVTELLSMEPDDPKTIVDLRKVKHSEHKTKYEVFWKEAKKFLDEGLGTAVDDRRYLEITHLSAAISIRDFKEQVQARCPEGTAVPCEEWLCLQFWPIRIQNVRAQFTILGSLKFGL